MIADVGRILLNPKRAQMEPDEASVTYTARSRATPEQETEPLPLPLRPAVLDALPPPRPEEDFRNFVGRISFFCGMPEFRFVTEMCRMRRLR